MLDLIVSVPDHCLSFYFDRSTGLTGRKGLQVDRVDTMTRYHFKKATHYLSFGV